jgi:K+-sensing histidine kinase KdpD
MNYQEYSTEDFRQAFSTLAGLVNQLPSAQRAELRSQLGAYSHDFKHTLGVVVGANGILLRLNMNGGEETEDVEEMTDMITRATSQLDGLIMLLVESLNNQIETG